MFEGLGDRLKNIFSAMSKKNSVDEKDILSAMREIRIALLEADVSLVAIKKLIERVKEKALGEKVLRSIKPYELISKIVQDEIEVILGGDPDEKEEIDLSQLNLHKLNIKKPKSSIMMVGLQGAGKTTTAGKLALYLKKAHNKRVLLCPIDVHRYAAYDQLKTLGESINIDVLDLSEEDRKKGAVFCAKRGLAAAEKVEYDVLIFDTAGRLQTDEDMMAELKEVNEVIKPNEKLLVVDSLIGQEAVKIGRAFNSEVGLTGIILTRIDGDARGGAALSMTSEIGVQIKFIGVGEKAKELEVFHPRRIASRILGMGDIVSLVEKAKMEDLGDEKVLEKLSQGRFTMYDMLDQIKKIKKMGSIASILSLIPGASGLKDMMKDKINDDILNKTTAIMSSMTKKELFDPEILNASRRRRIARGAGVDVQEVNKLIKRYNSMNSMMKKLKGLGKGGMAQMMEGLMKGRK